MTLSNQASQLEADDQLARYSRQILLAQIGVEGQQKLSASRATLIGCGALGTVLADTLVRAGLGLLRIVDRDFVELNNLQRQVLFTEDDVTAGTPKAVAAAERLAKINSHITIEPHVTDARGENIEALCAGAHLILDGTDNFETRFLINDVAIKTSTPWIYGACVGSEGMVMPILPGQTPCLRCVWDRPPPLGTNPTCDTVGVFGPLVHVVASLQAMEAIKILTGQLDAVVRKLIQFDCWRATFEQFNMSAAMVPGACTCCGKREFEFLSAKGTAPASLCGRDAVQIPGRADLAVDFTDLAARLARVAKSPPTFNRYLFRFDVEQYTITLFRDGRAIIKGTHEPQTARNLYAKYIGL